MEAVKTYDFKEVVMTFGGIPFTGFSDGTSITISRNGDLFTKKKGNDGSIDRSNNNAFDFEVSVVLKQTSITNDLLSTASYADQLSNKGTAPLLIKDLNGTTLFTAPQAWVKKDPDDEFAGEISDREWTFDTGASVKFTGGN